MPTSAIAAVPVPVSADEVRRGDLAAFLRSRRQQISPRAGADRVSGPTLVAHAVTVGALR
ncbi:MAG: hypothetical protein WCC38_10230 [Pseudonocardiaceae bacterium]